MKNKKYNDDYSYANRRLLQMWPCAHCKEEFLKSTLEESGNELLCQNCFKINNEYLDSQEEEVTCPHCHSDQLEYRERMVACATIWEPEEREGWYYCWGCGEESEAGE